MKNTTKQGSGETGLKRMSAHVRVEKSPPLVADAIKEMVEVCEKDENLPKGIRDKALLLVGFAGALRRSELVLVETAEIKWVELGREAVIPYSKTDQTGEGILKVVGFGRREATSPVSGRSKKWLEFTRIEDGWLLRPVNRHRHVLERPLSERAVGMNSQGARH